MCEKQHQQHIRFEDEYAFERTIGQGHYAIVKAAKHIFSGERVAVKVIDKAKLDRISHERLYQEVICMKLVKHPNVVRLYEVIDTPAKFYLILEYGDGGDMYDMIMKNHHQGLSECKAKCYFEQLVGAIKYCHELHVAHRDLKPENVVFFEQSDQVKLTDFGFSNVFEPGTKMSTSCGSPAYSAPEVLLGDTYDAPAVDVWGLGVILYMLVAGRAPFQQANNSETFTMIFDCKYDVPKHVSESCAHLISRMLVRDPLKRIHLNDIHKHEWMLLLDNSNNGSGIAAAAAAAVDEDDDDKRYLKMAPLIKHSSSPSLSEKERNEIIECMINGKIAERNEILKALDEDDYNYITATYYLLAESILKKHFINKTTTTTTRNSANQRTYLQEQPKKTHCFVENTFKSLMLNSTSP